MTQKQIPQLQRDALLSESLEEVIYYTQLRYFDALKGGGGIWGKVHWKIVNKYKLKIGLIMHIILILPLAIPRSFDKHITQSRMLTSCKAYCNDHNILQFYQH